MRNDGRKNDELRKISITRNFTSNPAGSVLIEFGRTKVFCTASVNRGVPRWKMNTGSGWLTAEYSMLPGATNERNQRESVRGKIQGRTQEISRLIGRSLRAAVNLDIIGENTIAIDCDVLEADGGTRTAAITGAFVALVDAVNFLKENKYIPANVNPIISNIAAVSVGIIEGEVRLDLPYEEDSRAEVDMNVILNDRFEIVEVQGTGEEITFSRTELNNMLDIATLGVKELIQLQNKSLEK